MELIATSSGSDRPLPEAGMQQGILYSVIYLGTQKTVYEGKAKSQKKLNVAWELPGLPKLEYEDETGSKVMRPQCIFKTYTLSLFEKASLAKDLAGWRGSQFTKEEQKGFDVLTMLKPGANALLQIVHYQGKDGSTKAKYESMSKLMAGMPELQPENQIVEYSVEMGENFPVGMPDWTKDDARKAPEFGVVASAEDDRDWSQGDPDSDDVTDIPF